MDHVGEVLAQLVELGLGLALPLRPVLVAVDVDCEPGEARLLEFFEDVRLERDAVGEDDRLDALLVDEGDQVDDVGVDQRLAAGDRDVVRVAPPLEHQHFFLDLFERLVAGHVLAVAPFTVDVADVGDFQPGDRVVVQRPGEPVKLAFVESHDASGDVGMRTRCREDHGFRARDSRTITLRNIPQVATSGKVAAGGGWSGFGGSDRTRSGANGGAQSMEAPLRREAQAPVARALDARATMRPPSGRAYASSFSHRYPLGSSSMLHSASVTPGSRSPLNKSTGVMPSKRLRSSDARSGSRDRLLIDKSVTPP